jgi:phosphoribosylanthranilate isomerase
VTRTRIKICGVCRPEDAALAARLGADAVGLVFHPASRRNVSVERAREIIAALPPFVTPVGLFVDAPAHVVRRTADALRLRHVQLHGAEPPEHVAELTPLAVIKALPVDRATFTQTLAGWRDAIRALGLTNLAGFVLETALTGQPGGRPSNAPAVCASRTACQSLATPVPPVVAAGGLRPETVGAVVRAVRPWAVDVSSGVEEVVGAKSEPRLRAFVGAVRDADAAQ